MAILDKPNAPGVLGTIDRHRPVLEKIEADPDADVSARAIAGALLELLRELRPMMDRYLNNPAARFKRGART